MSKPKTYCRCGTPILTAEFETDLDRAKAALRDAFLFLQHNRPLEDAVQTASEIIKERLKELDE